MDVLHLFLTITRDILSPFILTDSNDCHERCHGKKAVHLPSVIMRLKCLAM